MEEIQFDWKKERLDIFLVNHFNYSRNFFHHIIARGGILVNGRVVKKSYKLKEGDKIQLDNLQRFLSSDILEDLPFIDLEIKFEKEDYLVIYKPKWVLSHPNSVWDLKSPSVVWFLYYKYKDLPSVGNFIRAWIIHRLDKDTDGFMIVVKTEKWLTYFKNLFNKKSMAKTIEEKEKISLKKYYKAKVNLTEKGKQFLEKIEKFPHYIQELVIPKVSYYGDPKIWITKILSVKQIENKQDEAEETEIAELNLEILTGRTHQIRYHLSEAWLPIVWDKLYGFKEDIDMQLTAFKLEFKDINDNKISLS